jgi:putative addiction module killer protein
MPVYIVLHYQTSEGRNVVAEWLRGLRDRLAAARIAARLDRMAAGNLGDWKPLRDGVCELRVHHGPGYRVYFARTGEAFVLLLCGGDKGAQDKDIERALEYLKDYKRRSQ